MTTSGLMGEPSKTQTRAASTRSRDSLQRVPRLLVAMAADAPWADKLCVRLTSDLEIGRLSSNAPSAGRAIAHESWNGNLVLALPDRLCSSHHAEVTRRGRNCSISDLDSKNGTSVNGQWLKPGEPLQLRDGDVIEVGGTFLVFRSENWEVAALEITNGATDMFATFSPAVAIAFSRLRVPATSLLVTGPTGVGKELAARAYHECTRGPNAPFLALNCSAVPPALFESELFGCKRGAAAGVNEDRDGYIAAADGGTLFLDEIGDLPIELQPRFLRVLQQREVTPLGTTRSRKVDFALVAATNRDLETLVRKGSFREDLLARINAVEVNLPPLAERREDLGLLISALLRKHGRARAHLSVEAARSLMLYGWPRNIRELENVLTTALAVVPDDDTAIDVEQLPERTRANTGAEEIPDDTVERLTELMREHRGNISAVARAMGKHRPQVQRWCMRFKIDPAAYRDMAERDDPT